jgi:hypothetical protein
MVPLRGLFETEKKNVKQRNANRRLASVLAIAGPVIAIVVGRFHGGTDPQHLLSVLPEYAANPYWMAVHLGQFLGLLLIVSALLLVLDDLRQESASPLATLGAAAAIVAASSYAANQAMDGVAIQFVAHLVVEAPAQERAMALSIAEAVRHVEQGLSGMTAINLGIALALLGGAIISSGALASWLGWTAALVGVVQMVTGTSIYFLGFSQHVLAFWAGVSLLIWMLAAAVELWRRSDGDVAPLA